VYGKTMDMEEKRKLAIGAMTANGNLSPIAFDDGVDWHIGKRQGNFAIGDRIE